MPPFITQNGQTGYFMNGQFVPASKEQYNSVFGGNPFIENSPLPGPLNQRQQPVQQGQIVAPPSTNEQKVLNSQGSDAINMDSNFNLPFGMQENGSLGFQNKYGQSFNSNAMTASGHPIIQGQPNVNPIWNYNDPKQAILMQEMSQNSQMSSNPFMNNNPAAGLNQLPNMAATGGASSQGAGGGIGSLNNASDGLNSLNTGSGADASFEINPDPIKKGMSADAANQLIGTGIGITSKLIRGAAPDNYDERVGMTKPNALGTIAGDATFTQIGFNPALMAATGGISAAVGGGIDIIKNITKYAKQKDKYDNKKIGVNTMQGIEDARESMKPDYTGYARFGAEVKNPYVNQYRDGGPIDPEDPKKKEQERMLAVNPYLVGPGDPNKKYNINTENSGIPENQITNFINTVESAYDTNKAIVLSDGYKRKLDNEKVQSKFIMEQNPDYKVIDKPAHPEKLNFIDYTYDDSDTLYNKRLDSFNNVNTFFNNKILPGTAGGMAYLGRDYLNEEDEKNDILTKTSGNIVIRAYDNHVPSEEITKSVASEEMEHITTLADQRREGYSSYNITPYAIKLMDENIPASKSAYLRTPTEVMAKKRTLEGWLIDNKMLEPGGEINDSHFDFLEKNMWDLPRNANDFFRLTAEEGSANETNKEKQSKNREVWKKRFLTLMNGIAATDNTNNNPYLV